MVSLHIWQVNHGNTLLPSKALLLVWQGPLAHTAGHLFIAACAWDPS